MHPFLKSPVYMLLMGLLWSPIVLCAVILESGLSGFPFLESLILIGPVIAIELFVVISLWFPCKAISFKKYNVIRFIIRHVFSASVMIVVWLLVSGMYSELLDGLTNDGVWREHFNKAFPLLIGIGLFLYFLFSLIYYLMLTLEKNRKIEQQALKSRPVDGGGYGLKSLKKRLANVYDDISTMVVQKKNDTFPVSLRLPLNVNVDDKNE